MKFAVVDIETTGLFHQGHGITEIAVVHIDGDVCTHVFHSMLNPGKAIPSGITHLTGIEDITVQDAPYFEEIAEELEIALRDRIFVAHNVNFDYNFLKAAFENAGKAFKYQRLCTMRYSRKLLPNNSSHRLKSVCLSLEILNTDEHRASGDALATAQVFLNLQKRDTQGELENLLKQNKRHSILPPGIEPEVVNNLPDNPGVYYFYGISPKPIYIGKAKNLKRRVLSHFAASGSTGRKQIFQREITRINFTEAANEYEALLMEDAEIKKHWPVYNKAQKQRTAAFAVLPYEDRSGKTRLAILKTRDRADAIAWFNSHHEAKIWLYKELIASGINPERAGMFRTDDLDFSESDSDKAIIEFIEGQKADVRNSYVLISDASEDAPFGVVVLDGKYRGYGHFEPSEMSREQIESKISKAPDSPAAKAVIRKMLNDDRFEKISLQ
ncbi:GIY-YIG nuclease family protein [Cryomorpha ignava]|uniref:GIY-YIG nuclease family protein n=1 Tax=Cryomorpha ignava TaxID=101383 RepID=A0A7K3WV02_9FLAO|nr:exonuclease domain-containing protein [Cryomorpha ignava]NEN25334.1 GIY-YIG nuclease family protein [Cryomorpha ignava]